MRGTPCPAPRLGLNSLQIHFVAGHLVAMETAVIKKHTDLQRDIKLIPEVHDQTHYLRGMAAAYHTALLTQSPLRLSKPTWVTFSEPGRHCTSVVTVS